MILDDQELKNQHPHAYQTHLEFEVKRLNDELDRLRGLLIRSAYHLTEEDNPFE